MSSDRAKRNIACTLLLLAWTVAGCSSPSWQLETAPVSGSVTIDGKPLKFGFVRFFPSRGRGAEGKIRPDGTFTMTTYEEEDGASIGLHRVTVVCRKGDDLVPNPNDREGGPPPVWLIPRRYGDYADSGLTFTVEGRSDNAAAFELTSQASEGSSAKKGRQL